MNGVSGQAGTPFNPSYFVADFPYFNRINFLLWTNPSA